MEVFTSAGSLRNFLNSQRKNYKSIGLVPTMGALHAGHIALVEKAVNENDIVVVSIFVNPTQFNNPEDLAKYPRTLDEDLIALEQAGCQAVFTPSAEEMYPKQPVLKMNFGALEAVMEGASRPGHFNGVGIVVSKLFNIVNPDKAYFGQKDLQQVAVIKQMVADLSFCLELVIHPTVRETDGLAMSSRNRRLNAHERNVAPHIFRILESLKNELLAGGNVSQLLEAASSEFNAVPDFKLDYLQVVDATTLQTIDQTEKENTAICVAVFLGPVRLIDNVTF